MSSPFTPDQLASLSLQIDQQLAELHDKPNSDQLKQSPSERKDIPDRLPAQWQAIAGA
uniref:hypothetical protein n=1 Tax=Candidatus Electronema sp. TaxID=2698783 RepID=UPI00405781AD